MTFPDKSHAYATTSRWKKIAPGLRKIVGNLGWLVIDRVIRLGLGLVVFLWVARYLGPTLFGSLNFATAFTALFGTVAALGLEGILIREILHDPDHTLEILGTGLALRTAMGALTAVICIATIRIIQPADKQAFLLVSILSVTLIFQAFDTIDSFFQSCVKSKFTVLAKNCSFLIFASIRVLLVLSKAPVWSFAAAAAGEVILSALALAVAYHVTGGKIFFWRSSRATAIRLLKQSWPVIFSGMAIMVYMRLDMVMLKLMRGDFEVGLYSAATRISEVWYFIPAAIVSSVSPAIIKVKDNPKIFYERLRKLFSLMSLMALVIGSSVALASHLIVRTLYSPTFKGAGPVLAVHIWASIFVFLGLAQTPWDLGENLLNLSLYRTLAGAVINVAINFLLIPKYGAMGAAISTVTAYGVSAVFANACHPRTRIIFYMQAKSLLPSKFWQLPT